MSEIPLAEDKSESPGVSASGAAAGVGRYPKETVFFCALLLIAFGKPLFDLVRFAFHSDLYSHVLLIPFISMYLARQDKAVPAAGCSRSIVPGLLAMLAGAGVLGGYWLQRHAGWRPKPEDYLAAMTLSCLLFFVGGCFLTLGKATVIRLRWPLGFLFFLVPMPTAMLDGIEFLLQHSSAVVASGFLEMTGLPVFRNGTELQLPGFSMRVAPECSGIHSSLVLFITSVLAGRLLLTRAWTRFVFALAVIPLGIIRNGLRIWSLGQLCVRVDPSWINSAYHHRGGPIWFVLSLIPLFLLLFWLIKVETRGGFFSSGKPTRG